VPSLRFGPDRVDLVQRARAGPLAQRRLHGFVKARVWGIGRGAVLDWIGDRVKHTDCGLEREIVLRQDLLHRRSRRKLAHVDALDDNARRPCRVASRFEDLGDGAVFQQEPLLPLVDDHFTGAPTTQAIERRRERDAQGAKENDRVAHGAFPGAEGAFAIRTPPTEAQSPHGRKHGPLARRTAKVRLEGSSLFGKRRR